MNPRRIILRILGLLAGLGLFGPASRLLSQDVVSEAIRQLSSENVRGYLQPIVDGFGANLNSGLYHNPGLDRGGLHLRLEAVGSATLVGAAQRHYYATPPEPFPQNPVRTATILGGEGTTVSGPGGVEYTFQNGQIRTDLFGLGAPQLTVGNLLGTEAILRYAVVPAIEDFPRTSLVGYGLRHSVSQYLPMLPVELSVGGFRQALDVGDIIAVRSTNVALMVGKTVSLFAVYGGLQHESTEVRVDYTYTGYGSTPDSRVQLEYTARNVLRWTTGFGLSLGVLNLTTDISVGRVTAVTGSLGVGF